MRGLFGKKRAPEAVTDDTLKSEIDVLKAQIAQQLKTIDDLRTIAAQNEQTVAEVQNALRDLHSKADPLQRPTVQALINLKTEEIAALPRMILDGHPQATQLFERRIGQDMKLFRRPAVAAAELLSHRLHTVVKLLTNMVARENIGPRDVQFQAKNDVDVLTSTEAARQKSAREETAYQATALGKMSKRRDP